MHFGVSAGANIDRDRASYSMMFDVGWVVNPEDDATVSITTGAAVHDFKDGGTTFGIGASYKNDWISAGTLLGGGSPGAPSMEPVGGGAAAHGYAGLVVAHSEHNWAQLSVGGQGNWIRHDGENYWSAGPQVRATFHCPAEACGELFFRMLEAAAR